MSTLPDDAGPVESRKRASDDSGKSKDAAAWNGKPDGTCVGSNASCVSFHSNVDTQWSGVILA